MFPILGCRCLDSLTQLKNRQYTFDKIICESTGKESLKQLTLFVFLNFAGPEFELENSLRSVVTVHKYFNLYFKGIVSRKFEILFLVSFESLEVLTPFLFYPFLKYRRFHVVFSNIRCSAVSFYELKKG
jgi:hypothetical protein